MSAPAIPALVLGGSGYVAGELLRLLAAHPVFRLAGALSESQPGEPVAAAFPHLAPVVRALRFEDRDAVPGLLGGARRAALFCAAPHGVSARLIAGLLARCEGAGCRLSVVDTSADFRYRTAAEWEAVYGHAHGAPELIGEFSCAVPEHASQVPSGHIAHPGCFATAILLASVPLLAVGLIEPMLTVSGVTGSTGSGRKPVAGTHHPLRHGDLYAYGALAHRHVPEIRACARAASGVDAEFAFVPHSGPFARGIHVTVQARLRAPQDRGVGLRTLADYYRESAFVDVLPDPPRVKDVVGSNYARLTAVTAGRNLAVLCVIDNLTKGAAGGAVQWMNRLFGLPEASGLAAAAAGWT